MSKIDSLIDIVNLLSDAVSAAAANTLADTGLSFAVETGKRYRFYAKIFYNSAATTTGARFVVDGPAFTELVYQSEWTLTATTRQMNNGLTAYNLPAAAGASSLTTGNICIVEGYIIPSAAGTVRIRFASEVVNSSITIKPASHLTFKVY